MDFGTRLKALREEKEWTRDDLADRLKASYSAIAKYETNARFPDQDTLVKLANLFDVSVDYLLGRTDIRKFDLDIENIAAMRSKELEGYDDLPDEAKDMLRVIVKEYYERFGKKKGK